MKKIEKIQLWLIKKLPFKTIVVEGVRYYLLSKEHEKITKKREWFLSSGYTDYLRFYSFWNGISEYGKKDMIYICHGYREICDWDFSCKTDHYSEAEISNSNELDIFKIKESISSIYGQISDLKKRLRKTQLFTTSEIKEMEEDIVVKEAKVEFLKKEIKNIGGNDRWPWGY